MNAHDGGAAFTPGPWAVHEDSVYAGPFKKVRGGISGFRAMVCRMDDLDVSPKEQRANARLIAAAPDLLEAVRIAVRQNSHDMLMTGDELRICEAAIRRATGVVG